MKFNRTASVLVLILLGALAGCAKREVEYTFHEKLAPPPTVIPGGREIRTLEQYKAIAANIEEGRKERGPKRLISSVRALGQMESESARNLAREIMQMMKQEGIDAGRLPESGREGITVEELARVDNICMRMMGGPEDSNQGPAEPGPDTISLRTHYRLLQIIARLSPGDASATSAAFCATNPLPADVTSTPRLDAKQSREVYASLWSILRQRLTDASRGVTFSTASLAESYAMVWGYAFFYVGNVLADVPEENVTGHEMRDLADGVVRISREAKSLVPKTAEQEKELGDIRQFAKRIDENVLVARNAREDMKRFIEAIAQRDDNTVGQLSGHKEMRTSAEWRDHFQADFPVAAARLELVGVGITESDSCIGLHVKKTDLHGKESIDTHYVTVRKKGEHWVVVEG